MDPQFSSVKIMKGLYCFLVLSMMSLCDASRMKIPLKSIKSPDGDIIDCIDILHQPAFDHPLPKNHTILMRPSYYPEKGLSSESGIQPITQLWQLNGRCPEGTIPIRRNQNTSNIKKYAKKKHKSVPRLSSADRKLVDRTGYERAYAYVDSKQYFGAKATINVWQPQIQNRNEFSLSQIWIIAGLQSDSNIIEAGWMVSPNLFGDNRTRLFTHWTRDGYQSTGCYNLHCPGFVQINKRIALGGAISPVSTYHGTQYDITLLILKDAIHDVWWLVYRNYEAIGYWPTSLFTDLADGATRVEWSGEVINSEVDGQHSTSQMGSGHFPEENFRGSGYFMNLQIVDESNTLRPPDDHDINAVAE